jgi:hypothetical protein
MKRAQGERDGKLVLGDEVEHARVAVDQQPVAVFLGELDHAVVPPLPAHGCGVVEDVAQAKHRTAAPRGQPRERRAKLPSDPHWVLVDQEDIGPEGLDGRADDPCADDTKLGSRDRQAPRVIAAVAELSEGREGDDLDVRREPLRPELDASRQEQHGGVRSRLGHGCRDREVAPQVAKATAVVGVEDEPRRAHGRRVNRGEEGIREGRGWKRV